MASVEDEIRDFIVDNFLFGEEDSRLSGDDSFMEQGIVDSTGVLELVAFIENTYGIKINNAELVPDNLDSINKLVQFINGKTREKASTRA
jgi:acyl carrier protein